MLGRAGLLFDQASRHRQVQYAPNAFEEALRLGFANEVNLRLNQDTCEWRVQRYKSLRLTLG